MTHRAEAQSARRECIFPRPRSSKGTRTPPERDRPASEEPALPEMTLHLPAERSRCVPPAAPSCCHAGTSSLTHAKTSTSFIVSTRDARRVHHPSRHLQKGAYRCSSDSDSPSSTPECTESLVLQRACRIAPARFTCEAVRRARSHGPEGLPGEGIQHPRGCGRGGDPGLCSTDVCLPTILFPKSGSPTRLGALPPHSHAGVASGFTPERVLR